MVVEQEWFNKFFQFLEVEKNASPNTVAAYRADMTQFQQGLRRSVTSWGDVTADEVTDFMKRLQDQGAKDSTVARKIAAVKSFFGYLAAEGFCSDPTDEVRSPKVVKTGPQPLTTTEVERMLSQASATNNPEARRNRAMIILIRGTGLRITELVSLDIGDANVDATPAKLTYSRKGEQYEVILDEATSEELKDYLDRVRPQLATRRRETALLLNRRGQRLTRQGCWLCLKGLAKEANVDPSRATLAGLRHTYAMDSLAAGHTLKEVQAAMGHSALSTTAKYQTLVPA